MIHVVCDPGSRYTKFAAARPDAFAPVYMQYPSHEAEDLGMLARRAAQALHPRFLEPVQLWVVGDGWVPKRTRSNPLLLGTALAKAAAGLGESALIADCGGLRTRVFDVAGGVLKRTLENERCTSGGGRFVETMSAALGIDLDGIDAAVVRASAPVRVSSPCMVFAESEMISQVNAGVPREDVLAGVVAHAVEKVSTLVLQAVPQHVGTQQADPQPVEPQLVGPRHTDARQADPCGRPLVISGGLGRLAAFRNGLAAELPGFRLIGTPRDPMYFNCICGLAMVCDAGPIEWPEPGRPGGGDANAT